MRRSEILDGVRNVIESLESTGMPMLLESLMKRPDAKQRPETESVLEIFSTYKQAAARYGPVETHIVDVMGLRSLEDASFWAAFVSLDSPQGAPPSVAWPVFSAVRFTIEQLPRLSELLARQSDAFGAPSSGPQGALADGDSTLTVIIIEDKGPSTTERLTLVLESVQGLFDACAAVEENTDARLAVIACDSGSDKAFDFLGNGEVVSAVKDVILGVWDRVVFYREDKIERRLERISESLPILARIDGMEADGTLDPEAAHLLKRQVIGSVGKFVKAGATIPEVSLASTHNPRELMAPEPRMLIAAPEPVGGWEPADEPDVGDLDFDAYMEDMARKYLEAHSPSADDDDLPDPS